MDLQHYNLFVVFDLIEASHLAAGVDPKRRLDRLDILRDLLSKNNYQAMKVKAIKESMNHGLNGALCQIPLALMKPKGEREVPLWILKPTVMDDRLKNDDLTVLSKEEMQSWRKQMNILRRSGKFVFDRKELSRWFHAKGLGFSPEYDFLQCNEAQAISLVDKSPIADKPLETRERNTLLAIIAALCKDIGYDYTKAAKTANLIQGTTAAMGVSIGETTIENHLKKIPDALATRMK